MKSAPKQTWTEWVINSQYIKDLDALDKRYSAKIHKLDLPKIVQIYVAFFALICNKEGPFGLMLIVSLIFPHFQTPQQSYYFVYYGTQYFAQAMTAFITCVMLKKHFKRARPSIKNVPKRIFNVRGKEIDCSWPSGDTA